MSSAEAVDELPGVPAVLMCTRGVPDRLASNFAAVIARAAHAPTALIQLTDGDQLRLAGSAGAPAEWARYGRTPTTSTVAGLVIGHEHPIILDDITGDPRVPQYAPARELGVRAYAGFPIRDPQRRIVGVCTVLDFQPRQWTPEELAAGDEGAQACTAFVAERQAREHHDTQRLFLDALLRSLRTGVAACDENGRLIFANDVLRELAGSLRVGAPLSEWSRHGCLVDAEGRPLPPEALPLLRALRGESLRDLDFTVATPGSLPRAVCAGAEPIIGPDGQSLGAVVTVREVTEQRRAERFRTVELAASDALAQPGGVQAAAPRILSAICTSFGWPYAELWLVDQDAGTLLPEARHPAEDTSLMPDSTLAVAAWRTGRPVWLGGSHGEARTDLAIPASSGGQVVAVLTFSATAVNDPPEALTGLLCDIGAHIAEFLTRRRTDELALALTRSRDDYLALIGHEMRTPLTSISAYIEMIRESDPCTAGDDLPEMIEVISRNSAALRDIVDQLLDLAALDRGQAGLARQAVDLPGVVRAAADAARPAAAAAGIALNVDLPGCTPVEGDPARLRQMVDALLDNAVKHTPNAGRITVTTAQPACDVVELTVSDTGIGVPADEREHVFGRFHRSQRTRENRIPGSGLGLALSRAIVESHHGSIRLVPLAGPGTRVIVRLPATGTPPAPPARS